MIYMALATKCTSSYQEYIIRYTLDHIDGQFSGNYIQQKLLIWQYIQQTFKQNYIAVLIFVTFLYLESFVDYLQCFAGSLP